MGVKPEKEDNEEMMSIPKCFIALLSDSHMSRCEHHKHTKHHDMACDATSLGVVYLYCSFRTHLISLNIEEAAIRESTQSNRRGPQLT